MSDQPPKHPETISEKLRSGRTVVLGLALLSLIVLVPLLLMKSEVFIGETVYPWLVDLSGFALAACIVLLLPLAIFRKTRSLAGWGLGMASWVFGVTLWVWCLLLTYQLWGIFAVLTGLVLLGVGVVPIAMLATFVNGLWPSLAELVVITALTFGLRLAGVFVLAKAEGAN